MSMLGLSQNPATLVCLLLAQADMWVPFSVVKLVLVLGWVYSCLYLTQRAEDSPLVPNKYRSTLQVASLLVGPLIFLALVLRDTQKSGTGHHFSDLFQRVGDAVARIWRSRARVIKEDTTLRLFDSKGTELQEIYGHGDSRQGGQHVYDLTVQVIDNALRQRASDILIDPKDHQVYAVRLRVDGVLRVVCELPGDTSRAVINSVKAVSSMDISERRRPQDGAFTARKGGDTISFRVATAGALNGEKISIRVLNQHASGFTLADVGIRENQRTAIIKALAQPAGMVLVCGPTGSGKTTTLYSMLNQIDRFTHNVITVEDPIEAHLPEASQIEINARADITFAKALRSILRQDPDVICVGEIRDEETASIALRAAQTGHLVLATIHCDSNATALIRLLDLGVSPLLLSSGLSLLVSQRLMRLLCDECKKPADLSVSAIQGFQQSGIDTTNIFQPGGCERCGGTGYYGRTAICDLLLMTDDLRAEIAAKGTIVDQLKTQAEKKGRSSLKSEALKKVIAGITSLEELKRVVGQ